MATADSAISRRPADSAANLFWLDRVKAIALVWIFLNHVTEAVFGTPLIANPTGDWPPLDQRLAQLCPLGGFGLWSAPLNVLRYVGWSGDQGVQLFLIASGFGLTWSLLSRRTTTLSPATFYIRRAARIYPPWIAAHVLIGGLALLVGFGDFSIPTLALSALGVRVTGELFYAISPAWWFIGLLLQLYLVFPVLWWGLRRLGPGGLLIVACAVSFAARGAGLVMLDDYVDAWQRGAIFITRLPEFALGMAIAGWLHGSPGQTGRAPRRAFVLLAIASYVLGAVLSLTLLGMSVAPFLLGAGAFVILWRLIIACGEGPRIVAQAWRWLGRHSYSLYLVHGPVIALLVPDGAPPTGRTFARTMLAIGLTLLAAVMLEWVAAIPALLLRWARRIGWARSGLAAAGVLALGVSAILVTELYVRGVNPQEVFGWGERPSLEPHDVFGWRLKPSRETRLRWQSYDYVVSANALGFPGPQYVEEKTPGTWRILTVGDAFTSAEGVDTNGAWPRVLESKLAALHPNQPVEVLNFAITGYGPNQYAAVVRHFAPKYRPDLILVGFFVNEYEDVLRSDDWFRRSIGFGRRAPDGWFSLFTAANTRSWLGLQAHRMRDEFLRGIPDEHGYFLGNFKALERRKATEPDPARALVSERVGEIWATADDIGARVVLVLIPAPVQVCQPDDLAYFPQHVDLSDAECFDLERPQRITREIAESWGITCYDLRPVLRAVTEGCPYQRHNMHWTAIGHQAVAEDLAEHIAAWMP